MKLISAGLAYYKNSLFIIIISITFMKTIHRSSNERPVISAACSIPMTSNTVVATSQSAGL